MRIQLRLKIKKPKVIQFHASPLFLILSLSLQIKYQAYVTMPYDPIPYTVNVIVCNVLKHRILYVIATLFSFFPFIQRSNNSYSLVTRITNRKHPTSYIYSFFSFLLKRNRGFNRLKFVHNSRWRLIKFEYIYIYIRLSHIRRQAEQKLLTVNNSFKRYSNPSLQVFLHRR